MRLKWIIGLLVLTMFIAIGCGGTSSEDTSKQEQVLWSFATSSSGSSPYVLGGALTEVANRNNQNISISAQVTAGFAENIELIGKGEMQLGQATIGQLNKAYNGDYPEIRALFNTALSPVHIVVAADSGINDIKDLKGKTVNIGAPGSITQSVSKSLFEAYGIAESDIDTSILSTGESTGAIRDNQIDASIIIAMTPLPGIAELAATKNIKLLPITGDEGDKFNELMGKTLVPTSIPGGNYRNVDQDVVTFAFPTVIIGHQDLDEQLVYELTYSLWENLDQLAEAHSGFNSMAQDTATIGFQAPLHPGAERYFKEIGLIK